MFYQVSVDGEPVLTGNVDPALAATESYTPGYRVDGPATVRLTNLNDRFSPGLPSVVEPVLSGYLAALP